MQVIIIGAGRVGSTLAQALVEREHDVVVIDRSEERLQRIAGLDCLIVRGVPIDHDVLRQAGIETADAVCCCTDNENMNIMAAEIAQSLFAVPRVLARTYNPDNSTVLRELGLDTVPGTEIIVEHMLERIEAVEGSARVALFGRTRRFLSHRVESIEEALDWLSAQYREGMLPVAIERGTALLPLTQPPPALMVGDLLLMLQGGTED